MRIAVRRIVYFAVFVLCVCYFALSPNLTGGPVRPRVSGSVDFAEGWTDEHGATISLNDLGSLPYFAQQGARIQRRLPEHIESGAEFNFISKNLVFSMYYNDKLVYGYDPDPQTFGEPYGLRFNYAPLSPEDAGKVVTIEARPVYPENSTQILNPRISGTETYIQAYVRDHGVGFVMSLLVVFIGLAVIVMHIALRNIEHGDLDLLSLGAINILLGLWTCTETLIPHLATGLFSAIRSLDYMALLFVPYPMIHFAGSLLHPPCRKLCDRIAMAAAVLSIGSVCALAFFFHANMHDLLVILHIQLLLSAALVIVEVLANALTKDRRRRRDSLHENRSIIVSFFIFVSCAMLDFIVFSVTSRGTADSAFFLRIGLFIFAMTLSLEAFKTSMAYVQTANRAHTIERIAYEDSLTGIANRTAWHNTALEFQEALGSGSVPDVMICQFDVNFLKRVNDTLGHAAGDEYLRQAAATINRSFGTEGRCYRTGGDEFTAIIVGESLHERFERCSELLGISIEEQRASATEAPLSMALGCATVSETSERTIAAAQHLADERMYANKRAMKAERTD